MFACGGESPSPIPTIETDSGTDAEKIPTTYHSNPFPTPVDHCMQCVPGGRLMNVCTGLVAPDAEACAYCGNHVLKYSCDPDPVKQHKYHMCDCTGCYEKECGPQDPPSVCQNTICIVK